MLFKKKKCLCTGTDDIRTGLNYDYAVQNATGTHDVRTGLNCDYAAQNATGTHDVPTKIPQALTTYEQD